MNESEIWVEQLLPDYRRVPQKRGYLAATRCITCDLNHRYFNSISMYLPISSIFPLNRMVSFLNKIVVGYD